MTALPSSPLVIHWFRRDLRWNDNRALHAALSSGHEVLLLFVFDENILQHLEDQQDARVTFLHNRMSVLRREAQAKGSDIYVAHGNPHDVLLKLIAKLDVRGVYANEDYEPYALERDGLLTKALGAQDILLHTFKDHVIKAPGEVVKTDGTPYTVFTPFSKRWHANLTEDDMEASPSEQHLDQLAKWQHKGMPSLQEMDFTPSEVTIPEANVEPQLLKQYAETRDTPSVRGTSRVSVHLRFGTVSIRDMARQGFAHSEKWLTELIWRDFYQSVMHAFPHSMKDAFRAKYDRIPWRHDDAHFAAWKEGKTGYPIVDAGMRELNATGFMHNRVRMVVASFFCKHLLLDWRLGERYFAEKLLDFELASNVGGWQWASGSGCDAAPYFRVFNPTSQLQKFDAQLAYVKQWVPEFGTDAYPEPIVEHKFARQRAIDTYKAALA